MSEPTRGATDGATESPFTISTFVDTSGAAALAGSRATTQLAVAFIKEHLTSRITLQDLGALSGANQFQIIRAFRRDFGTTPHAFVIRLRMMRAVELLLDGEPAAAVAAELGFVDQSHFTRHFKRLYGQTPRRFLCDHHSTTEARPAGAIEDGCLSRNTAAAARH